MIPTISWFANSSIAYDTVRVYAVQRAVMHGNDLVARPMTLLFDEVPEGEEPKHGPTLQFRRNEARQLMDALWQAGVRPTDAVDQSPQIKVMDKHLQDMRALAFAILKVDPPR